MSSGRPTRVDAFHAHLDECKQCREHPFALCSVGEPLLVGAASSVQCALCDDLRATVLKSGPAADLYPCPACVGVRRDELDAWALEDAERACAEVGVPVRWLS